MQELAQLPRPVGSSDVFDTIDTLPSIVYEHVDKSIEWPLPCYAFSAVSKLAFPEGI